MGGPVDNLFALPTDSSQSTKLSELELSLSKARDAVCGKQQELTERINLNIGRIVALAAQMKDGVSTSLQEDTSGGNHSYRCGTIIEGHLSTWFIDHSWSDSDGAGSDPTWYFIKDANTLVRFELRGSQTVAEGGCPIMLSVNDEPTLGSGDCIDGNDGLVMLGEVDRKINWLANLCAEVVRVKSGSAKASELDPWTSLGRALDRQAISDAVVEPDSFPGLDAQGNRVRLIPLFGGEFPRW